MFWNARRDNGRMAKHTKSRRLDVVHERPKEDWHKLLDELTLERAGDDITIGYQVVLRHSIEHPTSILTDSEPPLPPLAVQIVGADGSETLVTVLPR